MEFCFGSSCESLSASLMGALTGYERVHLLAHSWGAFASLNFVEKMGANPKLAGIVYLAPYFYKSTEEEIGLLAPYIYKDVKDVTEASDIESFKDDIRSIEGHDYSDRVLKGISPKCPVGIIHSQSDNEVPLTSSLRALECLHKESHLYAVNSDHSFEKNRAYVFELVSVFLAQQCYSFSKVPIIR